MSTLLKYHTTLCNPEHYWENNEVAKLLKQNAIETYDIYQAACKNAGCLCYSEKLFNEHWQETLTS